MKDEMFYLIFMWTLGGSKLPLEVLELATVNPGFYIPRYCVRAMIQIVEHHQVFDTNSKVKQDGVFLNQYAPNDLEGSNKSW